jgi:cell pole-organizing protein PopZ
MLADIDTKPVPKPAPVVPPPAPPVADILDLTEAMATPPAPPPAPSNPGAAFRTIDAASDVIFTDSAPDVRAPERPMPPPSTPSDYQGLISNATISAVDSAFNSLAHTVLGNNARTLEDLVKEMLRPMLKGWLDDNLPNMVERIVRAEIERVSRGRN